MSAGAESAHPGSSRRVGIRASGRPRYSLRRRLLWLLLSTIAALWLLIAIAVFLRAHDMADELFDEQMTQMASSLLDASAARPDVLTDALPAALAAANRQGTPGFVFQLWRRDDTVTAEDGPAGSGATLLVRSAGAPTTRLVDGEGFSERLWGGELWRFFSLQDAAGRYQAQVGQRHDLRYALARDAAGRVLIPLIAGLPLLAAAIWLAVGNALSPLSAATTAVAARRPESLAPLEPGSAPAEVLPLIDALNALFVRIGHVLDGERQFTANAAHELRTPLAALKTQAQVALRAADDSQRRHALERVIAGVDRMTQLTEQLLMLARLDPAARPLPQRALDLETLTIEVCAQLDAAAHARGVELTFARASALQAGAQLVGVAELLSALVRNLVDNAIRHAQAAVSVELQRTADDVELIVDDDGPGIAAELRQDALRRFERLGERGGGGSGLGLAIAARIAELHGGELTLGESTAGGLRARVRLPPRNA